MEKTALCLMYEKIKRSGVDIDKLVYEDEEQAIDYLHEQYRLVEDSLLMPKEAVSVPAF